MRSRLSVALATAAVLALGAPAHAQNAPQGQAPQAQAPQTPPGQRVDRPLPGSFNGLAQAKLPAVVAIATTQKPEEGPAPGPGGPNLIPRLPPGLPPGMEEFFGQPRNQPPPGPAHALGSGFVIDAQGFVVTNNHVVENAEEITVILQDKTELPAELVGRDARTDLAVLKVKPAQPLPAVQWGNSDGALVGDWVVAIGNPFGLGGSVTAGIISARARDIHSGPYDDFIQTDASINRGNSGGPLFNIDGNVIGVNTAIFSPTGGNVGIGFAIPSNIARDVVAQLRESGAVKRGWLGVQIQPVTPEVADAVGLDKAQGALVAMVTPGSPAAKAGVQVGDVIVGFAGQPIADPRDLSRTVAQTEVGATSQLTVFREGQRSTLSAEIALLKDEPEVAAAEPEEDAPAGGPLGLALTSLTPDARARFEVAEDTEGVLVANVAQDSVAARQGLRAGDVITRVGRQPVSEPQQVAQAVDDARKQNRKSVLFLRQRGDVRTYVAVPLGDGSQVGEAPTAGQQSQQ
ncbi:DegQ family serine endoprotease [Azospirillum sp. ST 5-10]|uniref:DegQ family serine endoprotease n=1 Tax=unclassified Azospirillum TaxID=2630922 RepID=UPI003F4A5764